MTRGHRRRTESHQFSTLNIVASRHDLLSEFLRASLPTAHEANCMVFSSL